MSLRVAHKREVKPMPEKEQQAWEEIKETLTAAIFKRLGLKRKPKQVNKSA